MISNDYAVLGHMIWLLLRKPSWSLGNSWVNSRRQCKLLRDSEGICFIQVFFHRFTVSSSVQGRVGRRGIFWSSKALHQTCLLLSVLTHSLKQHSLLTHTHSLTHSLTDTDSRTHSLYHPSPGLFWWSERGHTAGLSCAGGSHRREGGGRSSGRCDWAALLQNWSPTH